MAQWTEPRLTQQLVGQVHQGLLVHAWRDKDRHADVLGARSQPFCVGLPQFWRQEPQFHVTADPFIPESLRPDVLDAQP